MSLMLLSASTKVRVPCCGATPALLPSEESDMRSAPKANDNLTGVELERQVETQVSHPFCVPWTELLVVVMIL
jgi:hypothetical protein